MEKKKIFCIEFLLVLILYSLVICLVPLIHSITFWIAFILSIIEYIIAGIMLIFTADTKDRNSEKIFDLIKIRNTFIYLIVQLIFNIFSMCYGNSTGSCKGKGIKKRSVGLLLRTECHQHVPHGGYCFHGITRRKRREWKDTGSI